MHAWVLAFLPAFLPAYLLACLLTYLPACLLTCLPACLLACLPTCLPACLLACLLACLPACLTACLPAYFHACLPAYFHACLPACLLLLSKKSQTHKCRHRHTTQNCPFSLSWRRPVKDSLMSIVYTKMIYRMAFVCLTKLNQNIFCQAQVQVWVPTSNRPLVLTKRSENPQNPQ